MHIPVVALTLFASKCQSIAQLKHPDVGSHPCIEYKDNLNNMSRWRRYQSMGSILTNPTCDTYGYFELKQCTKHYCWCVSRTTGQPVKQTTTSIANKEKLCCKKDFAPTCKVRVMGCTRCVLEGTLLHCEERKNCWNLSPPLCLRDEASIDDNVTVPPPIQAKQCASMDQLAESHDCYQTCSNDGTCRKGLQCCSATCGYNCVAPHTHTNLAPKVDTRCCSTAPGYRERCYYYEEGSCQASGCCWDAARYQCYKEHTSCQAKKDDRVKNIHLNAKWFLWSGWSDCDCAGNIKRSFRGCNGGSPGQGLCLGPSGRDESCDHQSWSKKCDIDQWATWSFWTECTSSCGKGQKSRVRECPDNKNCDGTAHESIECDSGKPCPIWSAWSTFTECSATCAVGSKSRSRTCINGDLSSGCIGSNLDVVDCDSEVICPNWLDWSEWGSCPVTCGPSITSRNRQCSQPNLCEGNEAEEKICFETFCPSWTEWGSWSDCSQLCGQGEQTRNRTCLLSTGCNGETSQSEQCLLRDCPRWHDWSEWSSCSMTNFCSVGEKSRVKLCRHGHQCENESETSICSTPCGTMMEWTAWSNCSNDCDPGKSTRTRACSSGTEVISVEACDNLPLSEDKECNNGFCASWTEWTGWALHTVKWELARARTCNSTSVTNTNTCPGLDRATKPCSKTECPFFDEWSSWSHHQGSKQLRRNRNCTNGQLNDPGCTDHAIDHVPCPTVCPELDNWTEWKLEEKETAIGFIKHLK